jgi:hypothetical protein
MSSAAIVESFGRIERQWCAAAKNRNIELKLFVNRKVSLLLRGSRMNTGKPSRNINIASVEYDMKMGSASLFSRLCCGLSMAVLALAVALDGTRAVRAEDADDLTSTLQEMIVDPIMKTVRGLEVRLTGLEAAAGEMAQSFTSRRVVAQVLCVSDEAGAQTCITKAQLDTLLSGIARAEISRPSVAVTEAKVVPTEEPVETVTKDTSRYPEPNGAAEEKSPADEEPEHTGAIQSASSGAAIVFTPQVEVTEEAAPVQTTPAEAVPVQATPSESADQSDN